MSSQPVTQDDLQIFANTMMAMMDQKLQGYTPAAEANYADADDMRHFLEHMQEWADAHDEDTVTPDFSKVPGLIYPYAGLVIPQGFLACDGSLVLKDDYPELFACIGNTYGSGTDTEFVLPDLSGCTVIGTGSSGLTGATEHTLAQRDGEETHKLITNEMPSHRHSMDHARTNGEATGYGLISASAFQDRVLVVTSGRATATAYTGGSLAHNNLPPYLCLNYIITTGKGIA